MGLHRGCLVRNCLLNCLYIDRDVPIFGVSFSTPDATVTPKGNILHGRNLSTLDAWIVFSGAIIEGSLSNCFNGSYKITENIPDTANFKYHPAAYGTLPGPSADPAGEMVIGRAPSHRVPIDSLAQFSDRWELTTKTPHNRLPRQNVVLNNVKNSGGQLSAAFNTSFAIDDPPTYPFSPIKLRFPLTTSDVPNVTASYLGVDFYGIVMNGGRSVILENNRILNTTFGVYHAEGSTKDAIIRDNHFYNVLSAIYFKLGQVSGGDVNQQPTRSGASLIRGGTGNKTATFTTVAAHGFSIGQAVAIAGAKVGGTESPYFNGVFSIASVPTPKSFTYLMSADPGGNADTSPTPKFGALWQVGRLIIENNIIEIILPIAGTPDAPTALRLERQASSPAAPLAPHVFAQAFIRGNIIRHTDDAADPSENPVSLAAQIQSCASAIVQDNIITLHRSTPLEFSACGPVKFFNNQSAAGKLIQGYQADADAAQFVNELETEVDLSLISAL